MSEKPQQNNRNVRYEGSVRLDRVREAANDSARVFRATFVTFLLITLYLLSIILSVNDVLLFTNGQLQAPILNVQIKVSNYFIVIPVLLLLLHLNLLFQAVILANKVMDYKKVAEKVCREQQLAELKGEMLRLLISVPVAQIISRDTQSKGTRVVLFLIVFGTLVILPVVTLLFVLLEFLPYQSLLISFWHFIIISIDLGSIYRLWPEVDKLSGKEVENAQRRPNVRSWIFNTTLSLAITLLLLVVISAPMTIYTASFPESVNSVLKALRLDYRIEDFFTLDVQGKRLYEQPGSEYLEPRAVCEGNHKPLGLDLQKRSFKKAKLSGSFLCHAILTNAKLQGADLFRAQLQGAYLIGAQLQGAELIGAQLQGAYLMEAQFQGADLIRAQLQGAYLMEAQFQRAWLHFAGLQGADLEDAELQGADLIGAQLQGADLTDAQFQGADLTDTQLQGILSTRPESIVWGVMSFEERIKSRQNMRSDLDGITFEGGLSEERVSQMIEFLEKHFTEEELEQFKNAMNPHIKPKSSPKEQKAYLERTYPSAVTGRYTKKEAQQWVAEYKKSTE